MRPKKKILCVDDNEQALSVRKFVLETKGYRVFPATNAQEAIEIFEREGDIDLVVSDLVMPKCNGNELVRRIKEISPWVPAILLSGSVKIYDQNSRADAFLPKGSSSAQDLLERARVLLVRKRGPRKATLNAYHPETELAAVS